MRYILKVFVTYDNNDIIIEPIKAWKDKECIQGYKKIYKNISKCGHKPQLNIMDTNPQITSNELLFISVPCTNFLNTTIITSMLTNYQYSTLISLTNRYL